MRPSLLCIAMLSAGIFSTAPLLAEDQAQSDDNWTVPVRLGKDGWMIYENPRFGFRLPIPPGMKVTRPPANGDGQNFISLDSSVTLTAWGGFNIDQFGDVEVRWKASLALPDLIITYKRKTDHWFVISGMNADGTAFYERYTADKNHCAGWSLTYPQAEEEKYAAWVERIAKYYDARLGKGEDSISESQ